LDRFVIFTPVYFPLLFPTLPIITAIITGQQLVYFILDLLRNYERKSPYDGSE
jgi:hypothetical protein